MVFLMFLLQNVRVFKFLKAAFNFLRDAFINAFIHTFKILYCMFIHDVLFYFSWCWQQQALTKTELLPSKNSSKESWNSIENILNRKEKTVEKTTITTVSVTLWNEEDELAKESSQQLSINWLIIWWKFGIHKRSRNYLKLRTVLSKYACKVNSFYKMLMLPLFFFNFLFYIAV